eukprot:3911128-Amphidinium_carterae.3
MAPKRYPSGFPIGLDYDFTVRLPAAAPRSRSPLRGSWNPDRVSAVTAQAATNRSSDRSDRVSAVAAKAATSRSSDRVSAVTARASTNNSSHRVSAVTARATASSSSHRETASNNPIGQRSDAPVVRHSSAGSREMALLALTFAQSEALDTLRQDYVANSARASVTSLLKTWDATTQR